MKRLQLGRKQITTDLQRAAVMLRKIGQVARWLFNIVATEGHGIYIGQVQPLDVDATGELTLIELWLTNQDTTYPGGNTTSCIKLVVDSQAIDTGSALNIINKGKSDNIYLAVSGKAGSGYTDNKPTGIGIDVNKNIEDWSERSDASAQQGIQIWDWSSTNQGYGGPRLLFLKKIANPDTDHVAFGISANRVAQQVTVNSAESGYDPTAPLIIVADDNTGLFMWRIRSGGDQVFSGHGLGIQWEYDTGDAAYVTSDHNNGELQINGGPGDGNPSTGGIRTTSNGLGTIVFRDGTAYLLGDIAFEYPTTGIVLKDRSTDTPYRLYVDSGSLQIESIQYPPWTPAQLSGAIGYWHAARTAILEGSDANYVETLYDQIGSNDFYQSTEARQPRKTTLGGQPAITFYVSADGTPAKYLRGTDTSLNQPVTYIFIMRFGTDTTSEGVIYTSSTSGNLSFIKNGATTMQAYAGSALTQSNSDVDVAAIVVVEFDDTGNGRIRWGQYADSGSAAVGTNNTSVYQHLGNNSALNIPLRGEIAEFALLNGALAASDIPRLNDYAARKYGFSGNQLL